MIRIVRGCGDKWSGHKGTGHRADQPLSRARGYEISCLLACAACLGTSCRTGQTQTGGSRVRAKSDWRVSREDESWPGFERATSGLDPRQLTLPGKARKVKKFISAERVSPSKGRPFRLGRAFGDDAVLDADGALRPPSRTTG
jgi:hypothetical protein